jgi:integrase
MDSLGGKYSGVLVNKLKNGQTTFYIQYRNELGKPIKERVGKSPEMTKTKALNILNERKLTVKNLKDNIRKGTSKVYTTRKRKEENPLYTLNDLADYYFKNNKVNTTSRMKSRYDFHIRKEEFANLPIISLIGDPERKEELLIDFLNRKKNERSDKRRNVPHYKDLSVEEKEFKEYEKNEQEIKKLKAFVGKDKKKYWREVNKIKYLQKKNEIYKIRQDETLRNKVWNDPTIPETEKRVILGVLSMKTISELFNLCTTIVNFAISEKQLMIVNPFQLNKKKFKIKVDNIRDRYLTKEEIKVFLKEVKYVKENYPKHRNIYLMSLLSLTTAARQSTLLSIRIDDIDLENKVIRLRNHKESKSYIGFIASEEIKEEILDLIKGREPEEYLFLNREGDKPHRIPRKVQEILDYTVNYKRRFTEWLSIKDFRNTVASHLVMRDVPIEKVSKLLDHSDITITQRYSRLAKDTAKQDVTKMIEDFTSD